MFIGRQAELRTLHAAIMEGGACVLAGPPGMGKTSLATEYAQRFESAHPAGVWRVSLAGSSAEPGEMAATLAAGLRAEMGNPQVTDIVEAFAERVAAEPEPSLLIVDDIPGELTATLVDRLSVPTAGRRLHTVLITNWPVPDAPVTTLELGPLTADEDDLVELLGDVRLIELLGGRPLALRLAALSLRKHSPTDLADRLAATPAPLAELLKDRFDALGEAARRVLRFSALSSPAALPPGLLRLLLGRPAAEEAIEELQRELLAGPVGGAWQVHSLVRDGARRHLPPVDWTALARRMADAVIDHPWSEPIESSLVTRHAARLAGRPDLPAALVDRLHRRVAALHEPVLALPHHRELARRNFDDPAVLVVAAERLWAGGEPAEARECAEQAVPLATDSALRHRARLLLAEILDELGDTDRADHLWTLLASEDGTELPFLRSRRLRGAHQEAHQGLTELIDRLGNGSAAFPLVQAARLELARTGIEDGAQAEARRHAVRVIAAHTYSHLSEHADVTEAVRVLLDARLAPALTDSKEDRPIWEESAGELRRLRGRFVTSHGPRHSLTLALAVAHAEALTALGRPGDAARELETVRDDLSDRFPPAHPARFRAELVLGFAAARNGRNGDAAEHFAGAFHGFGVALGDTHANTLRAELALGVALKLAGRRGAARHMLHVVRHAPGSAGIGTELFVRSAFGSGLSVFPSWLWRRLVSSTPGA